MVNNVEFNKRLESIKDEIKEVKISSEAWYILCKLLVEFDSKKSSEIYKIFNQDLFSLFFSAVFNNQFFINSLHEVLKQDEVLRQTQTSSQTENNSIEEESIVESKKLLKLFLQISFFCVGIFLNELDSKIIVRIRSALTKLTYDCVNNIEHEFSYENVVMMFVKIAWDSKYNFNDTFPLKRLGVMKLNQSFLFDVLIKSEKIVIGSFIVLPYFSFISKALKPDNSHVRGKLNKVYGASIVVEGRLNEIKKRYNLKFLNDQSFDSYIDNFRTVNEKVVSIIIQRVCSNFLKSHENDLWRERIDTKLTQVAAIKQDIVNYCESHLSAFRGELDEVHVDWSNKVFLISIELLSILEEVNKAKATAWKRNVTVREFSLWLNKLHEIINRDALIDEWDEIKDLLDQENRNIEWKSSFLTPLEENFINPSVEKEKEKELLFGIIKTIIAMMNAEGGVILVGINEHPERVVRNEELPYFIRKNGVVFYDIKHELKSKFSDFDNMKRRLQDLLKVETLLSIDKLDKYWDLTSLELIDDDNYEKRAVISKISIRKSDQTVFLAKNDNGTISVKMIKRVNGRTTYPDPREYL